MNKNFKAVVFVIIAGIWISFSEFVRNELLFKTYWIEHYEKLGLNFPSAPVNNAVWVVWSLSLAVIIYILSRKFNLLHTILVTWFAGFVLMWLVIGNMAVLPFNLLFFAVPLSLLEVIIAVLILNKIK